MCLSHLLKLKGPVSSKNAIFATFFGVQVQGIKSKTPLWKKNPG
jgi:hypothetical protein